MECIIECIKKRLLDTYQVIYTKGIKVEKNGDQYVLTLDLNNSDRPLYISGEFETDDQFIDYVMEEFRIRKPFKGYGVEYFIINRVGASEETPEKVKQILEEGKIIRI